MVRWLVILAVLTMPLGAAEQVHVVLLAGDEEYRSEESLPMLAKILTQHHGFKTTVLFPIDADGTINPDQNDSLTDPQALDKADVIVMALRWRAWPDAIMRHFVKAVQRGVPIIALRTSTHAFQLADESRYVAWNRFGEDVLGSGWVAHWGEHKVEATRALIEAGAERESILNGVKSIYADTDVYEVYPPADAKILLRGQVLAGMEPHSAPSTRPVNAPMMPVAWTREYQYENGKRSRIFTTTLGAATDFRDESLRRLVVNAVYWGLQKPVPPRAAVEYIDPYNPTPYGFGGYRAGLRPDDYALGKTAPAGHAAHILSQLDFEPSDRIAIVGSGVADRMQHHGWLETYLHAALPQHKLVFRNLAVAGDELTVRQRPKGFGTPEEWLEHVDASVVFAFFGFNESFAGASQLERFKNDLQKFIDETLAMSKPKIRQLVLFSPLGFNQNQRLYSEAMSEVVRGYEDDPVSFINVNAMSADLETLNGFHLTERGDQQLAEKLAYLLAGAAPKTQGLAELRAAVLEKNQVWHSRYRTMSGNDVFGSRSKLAFTPAKGGEPITNFTVMQQEMRQREVMTQNRDQRIWSLVQGKDVPIDDSNLPQVTLVEPNQLGPNPDGSYTFLDPEAAIAQMQVHEGLSINVFASEKQFPELVRPVQMAWDTRGRLWVAVWPTYPLRRPTEKTGDQLLIFEDTDGDGRADRRTVFLDNLNAPTGFQFYRDGVLLVQAPDVWFVRDTDGDGRADWRERVLMGLDSADSHHTANSLVYDPGGAIYLSDGIFHRSQVETPFGPVRNQDGAIYRFHPVRGEFSRYAAYDLVNPHGRDFDTWGNDLITDATENLTYFGPAISGYIDPPETHPEIQTIWQQPSRPSPDSLILSSQHFPAEFQGNFLNANVIGLRGVFRARLVDDGAGIKAERLPDLISSSDPNFRPVALNVGPDGAVYLADWHTPLIGHMQHHLRDPNREHPYGRIYRISVRGAPALVPPKIDRQNIEKLLELLDHPDVAVRERVKIELSTRPKTKVMRAADERIATLTGNTPAQERQLLELLWLKQWQDVIDNDLLKRLLSAQDWRVRAAATRVLADWHREVPEFVQWLTPLAVDPQVRVRLQAVRAASFSQSAAAVTVTLQAMEQPADTYLDYVLNETMRQLKSSWIERLRNQQLPLSSRQWQYVLRNLTLDEHLQLPRTAQVLQFLIARPGLSAADRERALRELTQLNAISPTAAIVQALSLPGEVAIEELGELLLKQPRTDLQAQRATSLDLARRSLDTEIGPYLWASIFLADNSVEKAWLEVSDQPQARPTLLQAMPLLTTEPLRAQTYRLAWMQIEDIGTKTSDSEVEPRIAALQAIIETAPPVRTIPVAQRRVAAQKLLQQAERLQIADDEESFELYLETVRFSKDLLAADSSAANAGLQQKVASMEISTYELKTVREEMRFDKSRLEVRAGERAALIFENVDTMPHNVVIVSAGSREAVGVAASKLSPDESDSQGRIYVPDMPEVIAASRMLESGEKQVLQIQMPEKPGRYEFVCTFPGHWLLMWGELIVVP
jgi:azurin/type 1 glutamine amidotransferase/sugar lactone lactonase YvrE